MTFHSHLIKFIITIVFICILFSYHILGNSNFKTFKSFDITIRDNYENSTPLNGIEKLLFISSTDTLEGIKLELDKIPSELAKEFHQITVNTSYDEKGEEITDKVTCSFVLNYIRYGKDYKQLLPTKPTKPFSNDPSSYPQVCIRRTIYINSLVEYTDIQKDKPYYTNTVYEHTSCYGQKMDNHGRVRSHQFTQGKYSYLENLDIVFTPSKVYSSEEKGINTSYVFSYY